MAPSGQPQLLLLVAMMGGSLQDSSGPPRQQVQPAKGAVLSHCIMVLQLSESLGLDLHLNTLECACFSACILLSANIAGWLCIVLASRLSCV